jgi:hypothetical protein
MLGLLSCGCGTSASASLTAPRQLIPGLAGTTYDGRALAQAAAACQACWPGTGRAPHSSPRRRMRPASSADDDASSGTGAGSARDPCAREKIFAAGLALAWRGPRLVRPRPAAAGKSPEARPLLAARATAGRAGDRDRSLGGRDTDSPPDRRPRPLRCGSHSVKPVKLTTIRKRRKGAREIVCPPRRAKPLTAPTAHRPPATAASARRRPRPHAPQSDGADPNARPKPCPRDPADSCSSTEPAPGGGLAAPGRCTAALQRCTHARSRNGRAQNRAAGWLRAPARRRVGGRDDARAGSWRPGVRVPGPALGGFRQ